MDKRLVCMRGLRNLNSTCSNAFPVKASARAPAHPVRIQGVQPHAVDKLAAPHALLLSRRKAAAEHIAACAGVHSEAARAATCKHAHKAPAAGVGLPPPPVAQAPHKLALIHAAIIFVQDAPPLRMHHACVL